MKKLFVFLLLLTAFADLSAQRASLSTTDTEIIRSYDSIQLICGTAMKMTFLEVKARTRTQISCNYGAPETNQYDTIENKLLISFAYDSTGTIRTAMIAEISSYLEAQEEWAKEYNSGPDFSELLYYKSFYVNKGDYLPFIRTEGENPGDYHLYYLYGQVFKIELLQRNGLGCLSAFMRENTSFNYKGKKITLTELVKNTDAVKRIISEMK